MVEKRIVGTETPRLDGVAKVTGAQMYSSDVHLPNMMCGVIMRSPHPHAKIISIDTSAAEAMGAICLTRDDVSTYMYNERLVSVPSATYRDRTLLPIERVRHVGEPVMAVAHETEELAYKAMQLVKVEYEVLPFVLDPEEAMKDGAPQLYDEIWYGLEKGKVHNNKGVIRNVEEGNVDEAFAAPGVKVYESDFTLNRIYHNQLETKTAVCAMQPDGSIDVYSTTQSIHGSRIIISKLLGLPFCKVNVKKMAIGGGFGSSIQINTVTPICAALAQKAKRPVRIASSREEDFYSHHKYPTKFHLRLGVDPEGTLVGGHVTALVDFGAHQIQPLAYMGCVSGWFADMYKYNNNIRFEGTAVYTNKTPCCAMQGYGNPQINFCVESLVDEICNDNGWDVVDFKLKNYRGVGDEFWGQGPTIRSIIKSCGVEQSLVEGREKFKFNERTPYTEKSGRFRTGTGLARGFHCSGTGGPSEGEVIDFSSCMIKINEDGSIDVLTPLMDHGGGTWDAVAKIAADTLCVPLDMVGLSPAETRSTGFDVATHATRGIYCGGAAVYHVAKKVKEKLLEVAGRIMLENPSDLEVVRDDELGQAVVRTKGYHRKSMTAGEIADHARIFSWGTIAYTDSYRQKNCPPCFVTHFVEVEVDTETGEVKTPRVLMYADCGTCVNPQLLEGQLVGSYNRGIGYALYEDLPHDPKTGELACKGLLVNYKTPTSYEMPSIANTKVEVCDTYEPTGPFGAKGIGEAALASVSAAVGNAIYNAIGIRFTELPILPEKVLAAIKEKEGK
ncbi:MAG: xanthine dehydrogenase family protein molybdopterin-binding subunit [Clostridia bacterium]|nr:xanthine dehydrogenase family protein molybdopterin-binding subunit [Clostridia bacterium]MDD4571920.1 xanthine dehydrogenase family protein molybdopterin-binding subunit [Clostridia bacterium]